MWLTEVHACAPALARPYIPRLFDRHVYDSSLTSLHHHPSTIFRTQVLSEGSLTAEQIDEGKLIDQHYYAIASKATILKPAQLNVPADKFKAQFGLEWQAALDSGKVLNAMDGCAALGIDADEMDKQWGICKKAKKLIKFGGGFYCGLIEIEGKGSYYVFNGFFMSMRSKFTAPGTSIYYYVVEWDSAAASWSDFRGKILGPTDPVEAPTDSLRGQIYAQWESLGLAAVPDVGDNGVHASASPFEALAERANWVKADIATDSFGAQLVAAGVGLDTIKDWSVDPQVLIGGTKGSLFDSVEDMDTAACIEKLVSINSENKYVYCRAGGWACQHLLAAHHPISLVTIQKMTNLIALDFIHASYSIVG